MTRKNGRKPTTARLAELATEAVRVKASRPRRRRPPEPELRGRALEHLVDEVLAELERGQRSGNPGALAERMCATCGKAGKCSALGQALAKVRSSRSRAIVASGCCADWQQQDEDHQGARDACPADTPAEVADPWGWGAR